MVQVDTKLCDGCGECLPACPYDALRVEGGMVRVLETCTLCGACIPVCPKGALKIEESTRTTDLGWQGVWVIGEQRRGSIQPITYELLGAGRRLAEKRATKLTCVLLGYQVLGLEELIARGADEVLYLNCPALEEFLVEPYTQALTELITEYRPEIVLGGATSIGRSLLPRLAVRLGTGLTADCTGLDIDPEEGILLQTRPAFGGNILATITCSAHRPQMATVRPKVMQPLPSNPNRKGRMIERSVDHLKHRTSFLGFTPDESQQVNLADAEVIVSGGRGLKDPKNFSLIEELAGLLGGAVGGPGPWSMRAGSPTPIRWARLAEPWPQTST